MSGEHWVCYRGVFVYTCPILHDSRYAMTHDRLATYLMYLLGLFIFCYSVGYILTWGLLLLVMYGQYAN